MTDIRDEAHLEHIIECIDHRTAIAKHLPELYQSIKKLYKEHYGQH